MRNYFFLCLALLLTVLAESAVAAEPGSLRLSSHDGYVGIGIENRGDRELHIDADVDYRGVAPAIVLIFHTKDGACRSCSYTLDRGNRGFQVPPNPPTITLRPLEVYGRLFVARDVALDYGLKPGCYGMYAKYTDRKSGMRLTSNAVRICLS